MLNKKRRMLLIFLSVLTGSLISLWIMKKRMGTLKESDYFQVGFNFLFAAAIVIGISLLLQKMDRNEQNKNGKK
ncbi:MAG: hypothetical protein DWQ44_02640 [Bacteroidetes bacterium]|nr:MAG: hypothetical protein DWQ33_06370 [Bacteroidota bacterium]REK04867.1 MAG: hypothetical protein DWQ39_06535 [Bacteroidota bacterium]REK36339.1 MAG: hypothetical protein DWQ44_02640 [Bacteroidota bacterium]REK50995.1 MAG: hypothetical protein DWQ48_02580 [Bacteroidota bacterium]